MEPPTFLLYGANGYTGKLILETARDFGLTPVLAGRSKDKIAPLAEQHGFSYRIFDLHNPSAVEKGLEGIPVVLHAAGPFIYTALPMISACVRTRTHYLDITGEIRVFETAHHFGEEARKAGVMLLPGTGFDVVPTDCLALYLKKQLPDATHLKLAFATLGGGVSHGTALTMVENLGQPGVVRENGRIQEVPLGHKTMWVDFPEKRLFTMTIPWGDVSTAFYSTGIPNIEVYSGISPSTYRWMKRMSSLNALLRSRLVQRLARYWVDQRPEGPTPGQRERARSVVWGEVRNAGGEIRQASLVTPEGYSLTAQTSLLIAKKVLQGNAPAGFQTPARAYGEDLILEIEGVERR